MATSTGFSLFMSRRTRLILLILCPPLAAAVSFALHANALVSVLLFLGLPAAIAAVGLPRRMLAKLGLFTLIVAPTAIIVIDYIAEQNFTWLFFESTIFPFHLLRFVSVEVIIWAVLNIFAVVAFYERFFERHHRIRIAEPAARYLLFLIVSVAILFIGAYLRNAGVIIVPYFYASFGTILILAPLFLFLLHHSALAGKFFLTGAYFFYLSFIYEVTALRLGQWSFPGTQYLGWVSVAGAGFPLDEFIFWLMLFAMAVLAYYEHFNDDRR